ncbi:monovalent cation:proton antiporter-2 (CPA2) family protein [Roseobacter sinensis]|uniref:Monovalent cation:proton antiporter-2 (CPA2) family protein n=1 Tax=Roseobacter sinensis TaxID=2931391 RepID=A0ABT3BL31_9RHOB|nr:monovalent cation:proton antiporter-2 (CPA2) family protein [Roseobacter sp. WL0113]MCV3274271.1 monovalent cation:proton antiporter-2 (CPA2) family protein [Roseobacter sp. WL0113]
MRVEDFGFSALELQFLEALCLIILACLFVPMSKRLGVGIIVGYLAAGIAAGLLLTSGLSDHPEELLHFAEFGIVLFLFIIGLEFRPARLWEMRSTIFGRGTVQVLVCGAFLAAPPYFLGLDWRASMVIGLGLALSSTALVLQSLDEKGERNSEYGGTAISILLFEDLAIVPLLLLVTLLSATGDATTWSQGLQAVGLGLLAIGILIAVGRYALDPMFRVLARAELPEIMTASALGLVIASALLMDAVGLSYAMGAFIAGVMLAESAFRHEVEADIEPFRGLFLGLFFLAVGLTIDLATLRENWVLILIAVPVCVGLKGLAIYLVSRLFRSKHEDAARLAFTLSQHGEFGFVLFAAAASGQLIDIQTASILISIVSLSMAISTLVDRFGNVIIGGTPHTEPQEDFGDVEGQVLIVGFGRVGQLVAQPLLAEGISVTLLDNDPDRIREAGKFGCRVHFGDGTRRDVLRAAGAADARMIVVCTDAHMVTDKVVALAQREFDQARLVVRAWDRVHALRLKQANVDAVVRETAASAHLIAQQAFRALGRSEAEAFDIVKRSEEQDEVLLKAQESMVHEAADAPEVLETIAPTPSKIRTALK